MKMRTKRINNSHWAHYGIFRLKYFVAISIRVNIIEFIDFWLRGSKYSFRIIAIVKLDVNISRALWNEGHSTNCMQNYSSVWHDVISTKSAQGSLSKLRSTSISMNMEMTPFFMLIFCSFVHTVFFPPTRNIFFLYFFIFHANFGWFDFVLARCDNYA